MSRSVLEKSIGGALASLSANRLSVAVMEAEIADIDARLSTMGEKDRAEAMALAERGDALESAVKLAKKGERAFYKRLRSVLSIGCDNAKEADFLACFAVRDRGKPFDIGKEAEARGIGYVRARALLGWMAKVTNVRIGECVGDIVFPSLER